MNYGNDTFASNWLFTIGCIAEIILTIVLKTKGMLSTGIVLTIVICFVAVNIPFGTVIVFAICKFAGVLSVGWGWVVLALVLDLCTNAVYHSMLNE